MRRFLLDSSVWLASVDDDDRYHESAGRLLEAGKAGEDLVAPGHALSPDAAVAP